MRVVEGGWGGKLRPELDQTASLPELELRRNLAVSWSAFGRKFEKCPLHSSLLSLLAASGVDTMTMRVGMEGEREREEGIHFVRERGGKVR